MRLREVPEPGESSRNWQKQQIKRAEKSAQTLFDYLQKPENKNLNELAGIPMLLQIMALVWDVQDGELPENQAKLYDKAMNYLLADREKKGRKSMVPIEDTRLARMVMEKVSLWIHEDIGKDEIEKDLLHPVLQQQLNKLKKPVEATDYCDFLVKRAWILSRLSDKFYIFRHKSFRGFFTGAALATAYRDGDRITQMVENFNGAWWREALRYFINTTDSDGFKAFISAFFAAEKSNELTQEERDYLELLMREAAMVDLQVFADLLGKPALQNNRRLYLLDCLKALGTREARATIHSYLEEAAQAKVPHSPATVKYAQEILAAHEKTTFAPVHIKPVAAGAGKSLRNPMEYNAEYIFIPGGTFTTGKTKEQVEAPDIYFAKYPVTNRQYRRFICYLAEAEEERDLLEQLPVKDFAQSLRAQITDNAAFKKYVPAEIDQFAEKFRSDYDGERDFNSDDQPVVGINWFDAKIYCFWLSAFDHLARSGSLDNCAFTFNLPHEYAWEWAAAGREPDGGMREYPWPKANGAEPTEKLANFGQNVGKTTPVGRYPGGATPEGLHDMAGNVWEWQQNTYTDKSENRVLRGGAWNDRPQVLQCAFRDGSPPDNRSILIGFRCTRTC